MKKTLIAGVVALALLGGAYGIQNVSAASNSKTIESKAAGGHLGTRLGLASQYKDQIHQINQLRKERLSLRSQIIDKKDKLLDLVLEAKNSGNKGKFQQAKEAKQQLKSMNKELKTLMKDGHSDRKSLKDAVKNGDGSEAFKEEIATQQQVNEKLKQIEVELDKLITIFQ
ncbi:hypothetical protein [Neobacillus citreus]|uniref:Uncharacterized protein n=1 Tax=Neobacillus citreus TaxID=2833578 RepID=A0A942T2J1_9BACI|nr:hypothetical protein [Neobacillus citreus]MCH6269625.1 hypothetical protein [Neobacillus citreus]